MTFINMAGNRHIIFPQNNNSLYTSHCWIQAFAWIVAFVASQKSKYLINRIVPKTDL